MERRRLSDGLVFLRRVLIVIITVLILGGVSPAVQANSPAPSKSVWLEFTFPHPDIQLDGAQIWECDRLECNSPILINADGICDQAGCLEIPGTLWGFRCEDNRCAWRTDFDFGMAQGKEAGQTLRVQLAAQLSNCPSDNATSSLCQRLVIGPSPPISVPDLHAHSHWNISTINSALALAPVPPPFHNRYPIAFLLLLGLTVGSELLAGFKYLSRFQAQTIDRHPLDPTLKKRILITLGLIHGISYPLAWMIMESLAPVYWENVRQSTGVLVIMAIALALALYPIRRLSFHLFIPAFLAIMVLIGFVGAIALFIFTYGADKLLFNGLPYWMAVAIAEVFVIVYEAGLISIFSRSAFSFRQAIRLSILTNSVSILLGTLVLQSLNWISV